jgi:uncharacterized membrane protein YagU involved in acid resistance
VRLPSTAIALAGLVAGTIDIGAACLINHANPVVILLVIASGVLGKAAFHAGVWAAALGLLLQGVMSLLIAAIFVVVSRRWSWTRRNWIAAGLAYGGCIFAVMNFVVVPLSAVPIPLHFTATGFAENLAAMLLFGLIVAMLTRPGAR